MCAPIAGCGSPAIAYAYFISYTVVVYFVFVNILVAVVLDGFTELQQEDQAKLSDRHFKALAAAWSRFDPTASLWIDANDLPLLIQKLDHPLGFGSHLGQVASLYQLRKRVARLHVPVYAGSQCHFLDVASCLARKVFADDARKASKQAFLLPLTDEYKAMRAAVGKNTSKIGGSGSGSGGHAFGRRRAATGGVSPSPPPSPLVDLPAAGIRGRGRAAAAAAAAAAASSTPSPSKATSALPSGRFAAVVRYKVQHVYAARLIQSAWRRRHMRRQRLQVAMARQDPDGSTSGSGSGGRSSIVDQA